MHAAGADVLEFLLHAALLFEQLQDAAQKILARDHGGVDDGLFDLLDVGGIRELGRVVDLDDLVTRGGDAVAHAGRGGDQIDVELALQALLHDFQMQQSEKAAAETEAQRDRIFRLEAERAVVQAQLFERVAQQAVLVRFHRIQAGEYHGLDLFEAGQRLGGGVRVIGDGVADLGVGDGLDIWRTRTDFASGEFFARRGFGRLVAQPFDFEHLAVRPQPDFLTHAQAAIDHAHQNDDAAIRIEPGIEDEGAQRSVGRPLGGGTRWTIASSIS